MTPEERKWICTNKTICPICSHLDIFHRNGFADEGKCIVRICLVGPCEVYPHCDNAACVNFLHLFIGTSQDNADDMLNKNRQHKKYSDAEVREVRRLRDLDYTYVHIGAIVGISSGHVHKICVGLRRLNVL